MTNTETVPLDGVAEALAEAMASMDGKLEKFRACKSDQAAEARMGYYEGYLTEARELVERLSRRGFGIVHTP
jgi:hypothetical protein